LNSGSDGGGLAIWCTVLNGKDKSIAELGKGLDKARFSCRVIQNTAEFLDGGVQTVLEVDEGIRGPELLTKLFASNDIAGVVEQKGQNLEGLRTKLDLSPELIEFSGIEM
jgi:hypothetical protein